MKLHKFLFWSGVAVMGSGMVVLASIPTFFIRSHVVGTQLLTDVNNMDLSSFAEADSAPKLPKGLKGKLFIPKLSLTAPVVEGTGNNSIAVAVGHLSTSVQPGNDGTSVLAAHNATWFRHIDRLTPGDLIEVISTQGSFHFVVKEAQVVHEGDPIYNSTGASLVLETCYPLNALYLTPYRYLVFADLDTNLSVGPDVPDNIGNPPTSAVNYTTHIPARIRKQGLTLQTNSLPMGTLTYKGTPSDPFVQSDAPLNAAHAMVQLYLAMLHAASVRDKTAMESMLAGSSHGNPLFGTKLGSIQYVSRFDVQLHVVGTQLEDMTASTVVRTDAVYAVSLHAQVRGTDVVLTSFHVKKR